MAGSPPRSSRFDALPPGRRNVRIVLLYNFLFSLGLTAWQGQILTIFLHDLVVSDTVQIGLIEGIQGVVQLISGVSIGFIVDKMGVKHRNTLNQVCVAYSCVVLTICVICLHVRVTWAWYMCCSLWAPVIGLQNSIVESLFADSVVSGARVGDYTNKRLCSLAGFFTAPVLQLGMLAVCTVDNAWTQGTLLTFMTFGIIVCIIASLTQLLLDQRDTLGMQSEALHERVSGTHRPGSALLQLQPATVSHRTNPTGTDPPEACATTVNISQMEAQPPTSAQHDAVAHEASRLSVSESEKSAARVRWTILIYDIIRVLSGGMAVKWYGLFFDEVFGMTPSLFMCLLITSRLCMIAVVKLAGWLCKKGALRTRVCFGLLFLNCCGNFSIAYGGNLWLDAFGWILRDAALNGVFGLKQTILMDHVPKENRGAWNSVASLNGGFWSGSAMFGGWLIQHYGFSANFAVMSWGFVLALLSWMYLMKHCHK